MPRNNDCAKRGNLNHLNHFLIRLGDPIAQDGVIRSLLDQIPLGTTQRGCSQRPTIVSKYMSVSCVTHVPGIECIGLFTVVLQ